MFWGNCSTLKVMNYRKDDIVEHITEYMFFLTTECGMCQAVRAGLKECLGVSWAGEGFNLAICSRLCVAIAKVGLPAHRGRSSGCKNHGGAFLKAGCSTETLCREGLCSVHGLWGCWALCFAQRWEWSWGRVWSTWLRELGKVQPGEKEDQGDPLTLCNSLTGGCSQVGVTLVSLEIMGRKRGSSLKLCQGRFRLTIVSNFFMERFVQPWHRLARARVESPSLEGFKSSADVAPGGMGQHFGLAVLGQWLSSEGFSNPNKFVFL